MLLVIGRVGCWCCSAALRRALVLLLLLTLSFLRSRILEMPKNTLDKLRAVASRKSLSVEELSEALQQLYVTEQNGDKTLLVQSRDRVRSEEKTSEIK